MANRLVHVRVYPKSRRAGVEITGSGRLKVYVNAPPDKGRANREAIERVAGHFGLPKSRVTIARGAASRDKVLCLEARED